MPAVFNDAEVQALLQVLGGVPVSAFDTRTKKSVLHKLLDERNVVIDASRCIGEGDGAAFMLENVGAGEVVAAVKVLRAATGWGLKEAKDAFDAADPHKQGGTLGPFRSAAPTFEHLGAQYNKYQKEFKFSTSIRLVAI